MTLPDPSHGERGAPASPLDVSLAAGLGFCTTWVWLRGWDEGLAYVLPTLAQVGILVAAVELIDYWRTR